MAAMIARVTPSKPAIEHGGLDRALFGRLCRHTAETQEANGAFRERTPEPAARR